MKTKKYLIALAIFGGFLYTGIAASTSIENEQKSERIEKRIKREIIASTKIEKRIKREIIASTKIEKRIKREIIA